MIILIKSIKLDQILFLAISAFVINELSNAHLIFLTLVIFPFLS